MIRSTVALRHSKAAFAALALASNAPATAQPMPGMLTIDRGAPVRVASPAAVRRALGRCLRANGCAGILLMQPCDRCNLAAAAEGAGFTLQTGMGQPGPLRDLFDNRPGRRGSRIFTRAETVEIFAAAIVGREPPYVDTAVADDQ